MRQYVSPKTPIMAIEQPDIALCDLLYNCNVISQIRIDCVITVHQHISFKKSSPNI